MNSELFAAALLSARKEHSFPIKNFYENTSCSVFYQRESQIKDSIRSMSVHAGEIK